MIRFAIFVGIALHVAVAVWNGFFGPSPGAEGDAVKFHLEALYYASNLRQFEYITGFIYSYFLGILYRVFSDHIFFGSIVSVIAWWISAIFLTRTLQNLKCSEKRIAFIIFVYAVWPTALLNTSVTLREAYQALAIHMIVYASINCFWLRKNSWITLFLGMALASVLHGALVAYSGVMFILTVYYFSQERLKLSLSTRLTFTAVFGAAGAALALLILGNVAYNLDKGIVSAVQSYNEGALLISSRADYRTDVYFSGPLDFILFAPKAFFQYMFEPLPIRSLSAADYALFLENVVRVLILIYAIYVNRVLDKAPRSWHSFVIFSYLALEGIWSIGTVNWGTASRHHVPALGLLLIAAFYTPVTSRVKRPFLRTPTGAGARFPNAGSSNLLG